MYLYVTLLCIFSANCICPSVTPNPHVTVAILGVSRTMVMVKHPKRKLDGWISMGNSE